MKKWPRIKPSDGWFVIILKLYIIRDKTLVYDAKIPEQDKLYRRVHNLLWKIAGDGLIDYNGDQTEDHIFMYAQITRAGRKWVRKLAEKAFYILCTLAGIIITLVSIL